jgi:hypothetical protein
VSAPEKFDFETPHWLAPLIQSALAGTAPQKPDLRSALIGRDAQDLLWSSGVLLGAGAPEAGVRVTSDAEAAFVQLVSFALQQAAALFRSNEPNHLRWVLGALLSASAEEYGVASVFDAAARGEPLSTAEEQRLVEVIAAQLHRRAYLLGNPADGLPLHAGLAALDIRHFVRLAAEHRRHGTSLRLRAEAYSARTSKLRAVLIELIAGLFAATQTDKSADWVRGAGRQVRALTLLAPDRRAALAGVKSPRNPAKLLKGVPPATRLLLVEQTVLAAMLAGRWTPEARESLEGTGVSAAQLASLEARAAAFLVQHQASALALAKRAHATPFDLMFRQANDAVQEAADAVAQEIRETGELGSLLARLARGETLTDAERHQMREQLIDLAKVVPSLAIFAAPGGMLLLPLVLKFLPFDLRPSSFQHRPSAPPPPKRPKSSAS